MNTKHLHYVVKNQDYICDYVYGTYDKENIAITMATPDDRKCQDYVYIKWEYWSIM